VTETTREIYRENVRMTSALKFHIDETELLAKQNQRLAEENAQFKVDKEFNESVIKDKIKDNKGLSEEINGLHLKIETLEKSLTTLMDQHELEKRTIIQTSKKELDHVRSFVYKLKEHLDKKSRETRYIKVIPSKK
jgi:hypothetical protein